MANRVRIVPWLLPCVALISSTAWGASIPLLKYRTTAGEENRRLIFVNNPEEIRAEPGACDLADDIALGATTCARSLHRLTGMKGKFRNWWEHSNKTSQKITYAVRAHNPGPATTEIVVRGSGIVVNGVRDGGREFTDMFKNYGAQQRFVIPAGGTKTIFRADNLAPRLYFAGVVDFDVSGSAVVIDNLAFQRAPAGRTQYMGYDRRVIGHVHESLVYKGLADHSEAVAENVDFVIDDSDGPQRLKVAYPLYGMPWQSHPPAGEGICLEGTKPMCSGYIGGFEGEPTVADSWITHIAPDPSDANPKRRRAVVTDIVKLFMPGFPEGCDAGRPYRANHCFEISPFYKWYHADFDDWKYPNWGNWAVHYRLSGVVENRGTVSRLIHLGLRADGSSPIAYRGQDGVWRHFPLTKANPHNPDDYFPYSEFVVNPGQQLRYTGEIILSGPATGTLEQLVKLVK